VRPPTSCPATMQERPRETAVPRTGSARPDHPPWHQGHAPTTLAHPLVHMSPRAATHAHPLDRVNSQPGMVLVGFVCLCRRHGHLPPLQRSMVTIGMQPSCPGMTTLAQPIRLVRAHASYCPAPLPITGTQPSRRRFDLCLQERYLCSGKSAPHHWDDPKTSAAPGYSVITNRLTSIPTPVCNSYVQPTSSHRRTPGPGVCIPSGAHSQGAAAARRASPPTRREAPTRAWSPELGEPQPTPTPARRRPG